MQSLHRAQVLMQVHYPSMEDPKVLMHAINALQRATGLAIDGLLIWDDVDIRAKGLNQRIALFHGRCAPKYGLCSEELMLVRDLREVMVAQRDSPLTFRRKGSYVICSDALKMKIIDLATVEAYLGGTEAFLGSIGGIIHA